MRNAGWNSGSNSPAGSFSASGSVDSTPNTSLDGGRVASGESAAREKGSQQGGSPSRESGRFLGGEFREESSRPAGFPPISPKNGQNGGSASSGDSSPSGSKNPWNRQHLVVPHTPEPESPIHGDQAYDDDFFADNLPWQAAKPRRSKANQRSKSTANIAALASSAEKRAGDLGSVAGGRHSGRGLVWGDSSQNLSSRGNAKQSDRELGGPGARGKYGSSQIEAAKSQWKSSAALTKSESKIVSEAAFRGDAFAGNSTSTLKRDLSMRQAIAKSSQRPDRKEGHSIKSRSAAPAVHDFVTHPPPDSAVPAVEQAPLKYLELSAEEKKARRDRIRQAVGISNPISAKPSSKTGGSKNRNKPTVHRGSSARNYFSLYEFWYEVKALRLGMEVSDFKQSVHDMRGRASYIIEQVQNFRFESTTGDSERVARAIASPTLQDVEGAHHVILRLTNQIRKAAGKGGARLAVMLKAVEEVSELLMAVDQLEEVYPTVYASSPNHKIPPPSGMSLGAPKSLALQCPDYSGSTCFQDDPIFQKRTCVLRKWLSHATALLVELDHFEKEVSESKWETLDLGGLLHKCDIDDVATLFLIRLRDKLELAKDFYSEEQGKTNFKPILDEMQLPALFGPGGSLCAIVSALPCVIIDKVAMTYAKPVKRKGITAGLSVANRKRFEDSLEIVVAAGDLQKELKEYLPPLQGPGWEEETAGWGWEGKGGITSTPPFLKLGQLLLVCLQSSQASCLHPVTASTGGQKQNETHGTHAVSVLSEASAELRKACNRLKTEELPAILHELQSLDCAITQHLIAIGHLYLCSNLIDHSTKLLSAACKVKSGAAAGIREAVSGCRAALTLSRQCAGMLGIAKEYRIIEDGYITLAERLLHAGYVHIVDEDNVESTTCNTVVFCSSKVLPSMIKIGNSGQCEEEDLAKLGRMLTTTYGVLGGEAERDTAGHVIRLWMPEGWQDKIASLGPAFATQSYSTSVEFSSDMNFLQRLDDASQPTASCGKNFRLSYSTSMDLNFLQSLEDDDGAGATPIQSFDGDLPGMSSKFDKGKHMGILEGVSVREKPRRRPRSFTRVTLRGLNKMVEAVEEGRVVMAACHSYLVQSEGRQFESAASGNTSREKGNTPVIKWDWRDGRSRPNSSQIVSHTKRLRETWKALSELSADMVKVSAENKELGGDLLFAKLPSVVAWYRPHFEGMCSGLSSTATPLEDLFDLLAHTTLLTGGKPRWDIVQSLHHVIVAAGGGRFMSTDGVKYFEGALRHWVSKLSDRDWHNWMRHLDDVLAASFKNSTNNTKFTTRKFQVTKGSRRLLNVGGSKANRENAVLKLEQQLMSRWAVVGVGRDIDPETKGAGEEEAVYLHDGEGRRMHWIRDQMNLGRGTFGEVFRVQFWLTMNFAAVKRIEIAGVAGPKQNDVVQKVKKEMEVMKSLDHRNIVRFIGYEVYNSIWHLFMEFCPEGTLRSLVESWKEAASIPPTQSVVHIEIVRLFGRQLASAVSHMHSRNIVHLDIKNINILVADRGMSVKLIDFGEAMELPITPKGSRSIPGTLGHMAPELFKYHSKNEQGEAYGAPADIWAIGCIMFEMLTGIKPEDVAMQLERKADDMSLLLFWLSKKVRQNPSYLVMPYRECPPTVIPPEAREVLDGCFDVDQASRSTASHLLRTNFFMPHSLRTIANTSQP